MQYTLSDLKHLAERLRTYASKYDAVVKELAEIKVQSLSLPNEKSLSLAMESLRRHVAETETALGRLLDTPPSRIDSANQAVEKPELYITPVGKNPKPSISKKKSDGSTKKKAE
jgi:hypothetical protein